MDEESETQKKKLLDLLEKTPEKAEEIRRQLRDLEQSIQLAGEAAEPLREIVSAIPPESLPKDEWALQVRVWSSWDVDTDKIRGALFSQNIFVASSSAAVSTSSGIIRFIDLGRRYPQVEPARTRLRQVMERGQLLEGVRGAMRRLSLDKRAGDYRTPLELLEDTANAFGNAPSPVLLPLRETIDGAIAELIRRRPSQEPTKSHAAKVESLGRQCAQAGLASTHFTDLGITWAQLHRTLSDAKQADMPPERISELFYQGLAFLKALLDALDERKFRPVG